MWLRSLFTTQAITDNTSGSLKHFDNKMFFFFKGLALAFSRREHFFHQKIFSYRFFYKIENMVPPLVF